MKQAVRKNLEPVATTFTVKELVEPHFDPNWHFHPHYQLFLVEEGTGTRFIGDSIKPFAAGDFVFLGPNLPHLWRSDKAYFAKESGLTTRGIVVYFAEHFLGSGFFDKPEMTLLQQLLLRTQRGLEWPNPVAERAAQRLRELVQLPADFGRVLALLRLLDELSHASAFHYVASAGYSNVVKASEHDTTLRRIQLVHDYVLGHFHDAISLNTVADLAGMTPSAFCRYFKIRANKTFSAFVAEVRIGHACKLLIDGKLSVSQISLESGYRTLSNFNRQFREITGQTPSGYLREHRAV